MATETIDRDFFAKSVIRAQNLVSGDPKKDEDCKEYENIFNLEWAKTKPDTKARLSTSPDPRNSLLGAWRLVLSTDVIFKITSYEGKELRKAQKDKLEKVANLIYYNASRARGRPIHYDAVLGSLLYGEMHIPISRTKDLVTMSAGTRNEKRAQNYINHTPFSLDNWSAHYGWPEWDRYGLAGYYRKAQMRLGEVRAEWGTKASAIAGSDFDLVDYNYLTTVEGDCIWVGTTPIYTLVKPVAYVPIVVQITDGMKLFDAEHNRQPFLYTTYKTGLWYDQNIAMTGMFTAVKGYALKPKFIHKAPPGKPDKKLDLNFDEDLIELEDGEEFAPLITKGTIDPALIEAMNFAERKVMEATMYRQAFGENTGTDVFSTVSLLSQSARLPLVATQKCGSWGIGAIMDMCFRMMKEDPSCMGPSLKGLLEAKEIPENLIFETDLDVQLPQEKLQRANLYNLITQGENPGMDTRTARDAIFGLGQSDDITKQIWTEKSANYLFMLYVKNMAEKDAEAKKIAEQAKLEENAQPQRVPERTVAPGAVEAETSAPIGGGGSEGIPSEQLGTIPATGENMVPTEAGA